MANIASSLIVQLPQPVNEFRNRMWEIFRHWRVHPGSPNAAAINQHVQTQYETLMDINAALQNTDNNETWKIVRFIYNGDISTTAISMVELEIRG